MTRASSAAESSDVKSAGVRPGDGESGFSRTASSGQSTWVLVASLLLVAAAFWNSTGQTRVFDDWSYHAWAAEAIEQGAWRALIGTGIELHWSPLAWLIEATNAWLVDPQDDRFVRAISAAFLLVGLLTLGRLLLFTGVGIISTLTALGVLALHPINGLVFYSYDVYTQLGSGTLMWVSLAAAFVGAAAPPPSRRKRWMALALIAFVLSILIKEQGLAGIPGLALMAAWFAGFAKDRRAAHRLVPLIVAVCVVAALFLVFWMRAASTSDEGPYRLCWSCVPSNFALLAGGLLPPMPILDVYLSIRNGSWLALPVVVAAVSGVSVLAAILGGLSRQRAVSGWDRRALLALGLLAISTLPVALLNGVREFHAHALLFWFAILVALAVESWWRTVDRPAARAVLGAACLGYLLVLHTGLRSNLDEIRATSDRAKALLAEVNKALDGIEPGALVIIDGWDEPNRSDDYSLLRMSSPSHLLDMGIAISVVGRGRGLRIINRAEWAEARASGVVQDTDRSYVLRVSRTGTAVVLLASRP